MLDTMRQVETHLLQRHYDGFLRKGRIRGRQFRPRRLQSWRGGWAGNADVAVCRHRGSRHRRRCDFSLRSLGETTTGASGRARFRQGNSGGDDHPPVRNSGDFARCDFAARAGLGTPLGLETAETTQHGGLVSDKIIVELIEDWLRLHGGYGFVFEGFRGPAAGGSLQRILERLRTPLDLAIWLDVSEETVRNRIASRLQCQGCGFTTSVSSAKFRGTLGLSLLRWATR